MGYWNAAWGYMGTDVPTLFNNSNEFLSTESPRIFRSDHPDGVQFAFLDGSVHFIRTETDPKVRSALVTRAGEEIVRFPEN
jgi:prepilin-type processing-associated H-X9-DG protein